jgi:hypothetical protein
MQLGEFRSGYWVKPIHQTEPDMTQLNWSRNNFDRRPSDFCGDDLPRAGSTRDAIRYLSGRAEFDVRRRRQGVSALRLNARQSAASELKAVVTFFESLDISVQDKSYCTAVIKILTERSSQLRIQCNNAPDTMEFMVLMKAQRLVAALS